MITPEERAERAFQATLFVAGNVVSTKLCLAVAAEIRAAIEDCAKIADAVAEEHQAASQSPVDPIAPTC